MHTRRNSRALRKTSGSVTRSSTMTRERPGIGPLEKEVLSKFGYEHVTDLSAKERHAALGKAVRTYGALPVFRKLNAVSVLTRYTAPDSSVIFLRDRNWVKRTFRSSTKE